MNSHIMNPIVDNMVPRPYQEDALNQIKRKFATGKKMVLLHMATGGGKCLGAGTPVIMFDGSIKKVEDVVVGDHLIGPDSYRRRVMSVCSGEETMYLVKPTKGDNWTCNESHMLSLVNSENGKVVNISVKEYLSTNKNFKHLHKLYRTGINWSLDKDLNQEFDPYVLGIYLAEGSKNCPLITNPDEEILSYLRSWANDHDLLIIDADGRGCREYHFKSVKAGWYKNHCDKLRKHVCSQTSRWIPKEYLLASYDIRLKVLAGLLDGDGYYHNVNYEISCLLSQIGRARV